MARVKDIESLLTPTSPTTTYTYKDKPDFPSHLLNHGRRKTLLYSFLAITVLFLTYRFFFSDSVPDVQSYAYYPYGDKSDNKGKIDWSRLAYSQYATDQHYLCNSLMVFASLKALGSKADRILFYPQPWDLIVTNSKDRTSQLLVMARDEYNVKLKPVDMYTLKHDIDLLNTREHNTIASRNSDAQAKKPIKIALDTWDASINKLHAFREGQYDRIIHLDSDITLLQNIDELFFLPRATVAMPRAYWKENTDSNQLTSLLVVLEPSNHEATALWNIAANGGNPDPADKSSSTFTSTRLYDMEILNSRYGSSALVLPHRNYALVTGEFRRIGKHNHTTYLGNDYEEWNPHKALAEAKILHFSDWPLPKPWIMWPNNLMREMQPHCEFDNGTPSERGCEDRMVWKQVYDDFRRRRKDVCRLLSVPAPEWPPKVREKTKERQKDE